MRSSFLRHRIPHRLASLLILLSACVRPDVSAIHTPRAAAFAREHPQAEAYATEPMPEALRGDAADERFATSLARGCAAAHLTPDGRLADLAGAIALASEGARRPPSYALVSFHAHRAGLPEPTPQVWLASGPNSSALSPLLEQAIRDATRGSHLTHCGAAALHVGGGVVVALVLSSRVLSLADEVPRRIEPGETITLHAELAPGYSQPALALTDTTGAVRRSSLGAKRSFSHALRLPDRGEYMLELLASGPEGLTVVAMLPIAVGVPLETQAPGVDSEPVETDATAVATKLLALIEEERNQRGLPALAVDPRLSQIALSHSDDMIRHKFIAHTSKRTGDATDRIRREGLRAFLVLENIGRGYSAAELHRGLMESPGHRGNILHPDAREIGIGVVAEREGERLAFIATELFTQIAR